MERIGKHRRGKSVRRGAGARAATAALAVAAAVLATGVAVLAPPALAEVTNPGFETDTAGWRAGAGTALARVTSPTHTGAGAARLTRRSGSGTLVLDESPDTYPSLLAGRHA